MAWNLVEYSVFDQITFCTSLNQIVLLLYLSEWFHLFILDDKNLPCVPSLSITVPENYPEKPPQCYTTKDEYGILKFSYFSEFIMYIFV